MLKLLTIAYFSVSTTYLGLSVLADVNAAAIPYVAPIVENASWLARQNISVWFALIVILFGFLVFAIIRWQNAQLTHQRQENTALVRELIGYLQKDHQTTVTMVREAQLVMQEVVILLKMFQQQKHDDDLLKGRVRALEDKSQ